MTLSSTKIDKMCIKDIADIQSVFININFGNNFVEKIQIQFDLNSSSLT